MIELMETYNQPVQQAKPDTVRYGYTGITELGLMVDDIDHWFEKTPGRGLQDTSRLCLAVRKYRSFVPVL